MADFKLKDLKALLLGAYTSGASSSAVDSIINKYHINKLRIGSCDTIKEDELFSIIIYYLSGKQITPADYNNSPFDVQTLIQYLRTNNTAQVNNTVSNKDLEDKISELEKENERLREENEELKTGASNFALKSTATLLESETKLKETEEELREAKILLDELCTFIDARIKFMFKHSETENFSKMIDGLYSGDPHSDSQLRNDVIYTINELFLLENDRITKRVKNLCSHYITETRGLRNARDKTNKLQRLKDELEKIKKEK